MKLSISKMFVFLAIVLSLVAVQAAWAQTCNVAVSGAVSVIDYEKNAISVDGTTIYGMRLDYLENKLNIVLQEGDYVDITAHQCPYTGNLSACTLSVNHGDVIYLPGSLR